MPQRNKESCQTHSSNVVCRPRGMLDAVQRRACLSVELWGPMCIYIYALPWSLFGDDQPTACYLHYRVAPPAHPGKTIIRNKSIRLLLPTKGRFWQRRVWNHYHCESPGRGSPFFLRFDGVTRSDCVHSSPSRPKVSSSFPKRDMAFVPVGPPKPFTAFSP